MANKMANIAQYFMLKRPVLISQYLRILWWSNNYEENDSIGSFSRKSAKTSFL